MDEDSTESKVDDLLSFVMMLVERQREEVTSYILSFITILYKIYYFILRMLTMLTLDNIGLITSVNILLLLHFY